MRRKLFFAIALLILSAVSLFFWRANFSQKEKSVVADSVLKTSTEETLQNNPALPGGVQVQNADIQASDSVDANNVARNDKPIQSEKTAHINVPFTSQAPLGEWRDDHFQDGCEEASTAMAVRWIEHRTFSSPTDAEQEIIKISKFEEKTFGHYVDADTQDVGRIFSELYGIKNYSIKNNFTVSDMKDEIEKGNILLVPAFGRALKNPNFTAPGPIAHMLVVVGWDAKTKEFITNDPGTRKGEGYRYDENVLFDAIWAYPSSKEHPSVPKSTANKSMLIVNVDQ